MTDFRDLVKRLADDLDQLSRIHCWSGQYPACVNEGCVARAELLAEARSALVADRSDPFCVICKKLPNGHPNVPIVGQQEITVPAPSGQEGPS
jgi:hypothetical protein